MGKAGAEKCFFEKESVRTKSARCPGHSCQTTMSKKCFVFAPLGIQMVIEMRFAKNEKMGLVRTKKSGTQYMTGSNIYSAFFAKF